jgi:hypothetical protein
MADQHSTAAELREALQQSIDTLNHVDALLSAFDAVAGDAGPPAWLSTLQLLFSPAHAAAESLECILRRQVLPVLEADQEEPSSVLPVADVVEGEGS